MKRVSSWLSAITVLVGPAVGLANVPTRLVYVRAPSALDCPDEAGLSKAVSARLGYDPFSPWGDQTILASVSRQRGELLGRAELVDHDGISQGSREVHLAPNDCSELLMALALAISITLDPLRVDPPPEAAPEPLPAAPVELEPVEQSVTAPAPQSDAPLTPRPADPPRERQPYRRGGAHPSTTWHAGAAFVGAVEAAPGVALGGRLGLVARRERWALGLEITSMLPASRSRADGGEVQVRLTSATVAPCLRTTQLSLCALGSLGVMHGSGRGIDEPRSKDVLYAATGVRAAFTLALGSRVELTASADLVAALNRPRFQLDAGDVWRPGPLSALVGVGVVARFF